MRRPLAVLATLAALLGLSAAPASAAFGLKEVDVEFLDALGVPSLQAGSHPFAMETKINVNLTSILEGPSCEVPVCDLPDAAVKNLIVLLPPGFTGDTLSRLHCSAADFLERPGAGETNCPNATAVGMGAIKAEFEPLPEGSDDFLHVPVYNLDPPPGAVARLGFIVLTVPVTVVVKLNPDPPYRVEARVEKISQAAHFYGSLQTLWGDPGSPAHDPYRGNCLDVVNPSPADQPISKGICPLERSERRAFFTLPRSCTGPLQTLFFALAWNTGETDTETALTEPGMVNCPKLDFEPRIAAKPTTDHAESPSGLAFDLQIDDEGITNPQEDATAHSDIKKAVVTLPKGVTANPGQAEGLAVCTEGQLAEETATSEFGEGCPPASKIGTVEVETPILEGKVLKGSLFIAEPYNNRFGTLIALYPVIKDRELGIALRLAGKVEADPETGQLVTTFDNIPQQPLSRVRFRLREGGRSPLITPPNCDSDPSTSAPDPYTTEALFTPWADPDNPFRATASFQITRGVGGDPCPPAGPPPFAPGFSAGTLNNNAGSYSPFAMRLTRRDGDQDLVRFDATLPPGVVAKLAGVAKCPDAAIAQLKTKTGKQELADPSCSAASKIGNIVSGVGVGSQLTYVPGSVYLAGPFGKAPLSVVGVVPAVAGPFDVGVVATRQALTLDPVTGQPKVDGSLSEPIPHILAGIPLKVRDIQVNVDRPEFTLNPTSCRELAVAAAIWGGGANPFSLLDDAPVPASDRFQAANCALLGFKPRLSFSLKGGTQRGANPAFKAVLRARPGDANLKKTVVRFARSTFLDQGHIRTVCTRVQFAADSCPSGSIYGRVQAFSPLLDEPLAGPVYLRSSSNQLPDIVFDLKGTLEIEAAARADSVKGKLRVTFPAVPDAPVSKVVVQMAGGKKGLLVNSRDICTPVPRAIVGLEGHNGKRRSLRPAMRAQRCNQKG
jgi:hypothetical protein